MKTLSEVSSQRILHEIEAMENEHREHREFFRYMASRESRSLVEDYRKGELSLILDFDIRRKINESGSSELARPSSGLMNSAVLVLQAHPLDATVGNEFYAHKVLIRDVQFVKGAKQVIPSRVWLYLGRHAVEKSGASNIYLSLRKRTLKRFGALPEWEIGVFGEGKPEMFDCFDPGVIQSCPEVVDRIASNEREFDEDIIKSGTFVLDGLSSSFGVCLDAANITVWQRENYGLNIRDVLIGPLNL